MLTAQLTQGIASMRIDRARANTYGAIGAAAIACCLVLLSADAGRAEEDAEGWTGELATSFNAQTGTVDTLAGEIDAKTERDWEKDVVTLRLNAAYGQSRDRGDDPSEDVTTQNSQGIFADYRHLFSDRFLWQANTETSRDPTQDREVRFRLATGPGYRFWEGGKPKKQFFETGVGLGYRYELFDGNTGPNRETFVFDGQDNGFDSQFADAIASFEYRNLLFDGAMEFTHTGSISMPVNDTNAYLGRTEVIIGIPLTPAWSFRTAFLFEYNNNAPDDQNKALTRTTVGLGYKF